MTGIRVLVRRNDSWCSVEIEDLTDGELAAVEQLRPLEGWHWVAQLTRWIRTQLPVDSSQLPVGKDPPVCTGN